MANRFPLAINYTTRRIEEFVSGDNLDLTGNGLLASNSTGNVGDYLRSDGNVVYWDTAGDVYLTATQTLTNKTLTSPILITPSIGDATANTINGITLSSSVASTFTLASNKTFTVSNSLSFTGTDFSTINFGNGGTVLYDGLATFANFAESTSSQFKSKISDETGSGVLVFNTSPTINTSIITSSNSFDLINTNATTVNAFGQASTIIIGASNSGTTTIRNDLTVSKNVSLNSSATDTFEVKGLVNFVNNDIDIRGSSPYPISIGRGGGSIPTNTRIGYLSLSNNIVGNNNVAIGYESALNNDGNDNTALGFSALLTTTSGNDNTAVGSNSSKTNLTGEKNTSVGSNSLFSNSTGSSNVCIGHYAGYGVTGSGNVLIGPADNESNTDVTYEPADPNGNRQLVIGSGSNAWIVGDSNFDVTIPNDLTVTDLTVSGNLLVNGSTVTVNATTLTIDDKNIELGSVATPSDALADGGGIILRATVDKTLTYVNSVTSWTSSENFNLLSNKTYRINDVVLISSTQIGPSSGTLSLGAGVTTSSLSTVGTLLQNLTLKGATTSGGNVVLEETTTGSTPTEKNITHKMTGGNDFSSIIMRRTNTNEAEFVFKLRSDSTTYSERLKIDSTGNILPLLTTNSLGSASNVFSSFFVKDITANTSTFVVNSSTSRIGVGTNNPQELQHNSSSGNVITRYQRTAGITESINLARLSFYDSSTETSYIQASRDGAGGAGKVQIFTKNTLGTINENIKFGGDGNVTIANGNLVIGTAGKGIDFSATANTPFPVYATTESELFDDYEEGTWIPTDGSSTVFKLISLSKVSNGTNYASTSAGTGVTNITVANPLAAGLTVTWSSVDGNGNPEKVRVLDTGSNYSDGDIVELNDLSGTGAQYQLVFPKGSYTKTGDIVYACFDVTYPSTSGISASEQVFLAGLPFAAKTGAPESWGGYLTLSEYTGDSIYINIDPGTNYMKFSVTENANLIYSNIGLQRLVGTAIYKAA